MSSTISKLLKEGKEKRQDLLKTRDYEGAANLRKESFAKAASIKVELEASRVKEQLIERRRLEMARELAIQKVEEDVEIKLAQIEALWAAKGRQLESKQIEREAIAFAVETRREAQKPVVLSSYVRDLQRSEKRLADFHQYEDSAAVRRRIAKREIEERDSALQGKHDRVEKVMVRKKDKYEEELRCFKAKMRNELALAKFHAETERKRIHSMYDHLQRDISHDQERESQLNPLLAVYAKPKFAAGGSGSGAHHGAPNDRPTTANGGIAIIRPGAPRHEGVGSAGQTNVTKGTIYFRKMQGSRFELPSLCDIYAHTLDGGDDNDGGAGGSGVPQSARQQRKTRPTAPQQESAIEGGFEMGLTTKSAGPPQRKIVPRFNKTHSRFLQAGHSTAPLTADGMMDGSSYVS